jgi:hypothetical protein
LELPYSDCTNCRKAIVEGEILVAADFLVVTRTGSLVSAHSVHLLIVNKHLPVN